MKINKAGLDLIKHFEGLQLDSYYCPAGILSQGYGNTKNVVEGSTITEQEADELLRQDVEYFEQKVSKLVEVPLTSNQFSALVCLAFNIGENALADSTLLKLLNSGEYEAASRQFLRWDKVDGVPFLGLTRRRDAEMQLFLTEETQPTYIKTYRERFEELMKGHYDFVNELITEIERLENS